MISLRKVLLQVTLVAPIKIPEIFVQASQLLDKITTQTRLR